MSEQGPQLREVMERLREKYPGVDPAEPLTNETLLAALAAVAAAEYSRRPLLERIKATREPGAARIAPSRAQAALLSWVDNAFSLMLSEFPLDDELTAKVKKLLPVVAAAALLEGEFLRVGQHPLQRLVDAIYTGCLGWHGRLGRAGNALSAELDTVVAEAQYYFEYPMRDFSGLLQRLQVFFAAEMTSLDRLRERVVATERGKLKAASARITAGSALNALMEGRQFSRAVTEFIIGPWYDSMQLTLITAGPQSKDWERILTVTETLIWTVQPLDTSNDAERQRLYKLIPLIPAQLEGLLISLENDPTERSQAIAAVEDMHFQLLRNRPPEFKLFQPLLLGPGKVPTTVTEHMLAQITALQAGQWFKISAEEGPNLRVQLALKMDEHHQLLFVNRAGVKAVQKTFEEFAYLLSSGVARPCPQGSAMSSCLLKVLDLADTTTTAANKPTDQHAEKDRPDLLARMLELKIEDDRRRAGTKKAHANLVIGSWVKFSDGAAPQLCKLAVRLDGLDKWVFVNERGIKQRELKTAELTRLQDSGHCETMTDKPTFENTVSDLVRELRDPRGGED